jgi:hypothetical protein
MFHASLEDYHFTVHLSVTLQDAIAKKNLLYKTHNQKKQNTR